MSDLARVIEHGSLVLPMEELSAEAVAWLLHKMLGLGDRYAYLIADVVGRGNVYAQFAAHDNSALRAEVVSNFTNPASVDEEAEAELAEFGWNPPESDPVTGKTTSPNHYIDWVYPAPIGTAALLVLRTLVEFYRVVPEDQIKLTYFTRPSGRAVERVPDDRPAS